MTDPIFARGAIRYSLLLSFCQCFPGLHAFEPTQFSGCRVWLDSKDSRMVEQAEARVSRWENRAEPANDAVQSNAAARPVLQADAINGFQAMYFDGVDRNFTFEQDIRTELGGYHVFIMSSGPADGDNWQKYVESYSGSGGSTAAPNWTFRRPSDGSGNPIAYGPEVAQHSGTGGVLQGIVIGDAGFHVGNSLMGYIGEFILYDRVLTSSEADAVVAYLTNRWGVDSDGDGLADITEDPNSDGIVDAGETDPGNVDSDGDGVADGVEVAWGFDPTIADSTSLIVLGDRLEWNTGFEVAEGYSLGALDDQNGWKASSEATVVDDGGGESAQSVKIEGTALSSGYAAQAFDLQDAQRVWVAFEAKLQPSDLVLPSLESETAALFQFAPNGNLTSFDGSINDWTESTMPLTATEWNHYELFLDYEAKTWHLMAGGEVAFKHQGFFDSEVSHFSLLNFLGLGSDSAQATYLDDLKVFSYSNDPYNSVYTAWLYDHGVTVSSFDADPSADPDKDSRANAYEYAFKTAPDDSKDENGYAPKLRVVDVGEDKFLEVTYRIRDDDPDLSLDLVVSTDLTNWVSCETLMEKPYADIVHGDQTLEVTWRSLEPTSVRDRIFLKATVVYDNENDDTVDPPDIPQGYALTPLYVLDW